MQHHCAVCQTLFHLPWITPIVPLISSCSVISLAWTPVFSMSTVILPPLGSPAFCYTTIISTMTVATSKIKYYALHSMCAEAEHSFQWMNSSMYLLGHAAQCVSRHSPKSLIASEDVTMVTATFDSKPLEFVVFLHVCRRTYDMWTHCGMYVTR